ncbi:serine peptidase [Streptomyces sp. NPDC002596]
MMNILIVHGIGNYRPSVAAEYAAELLKEVWSKNLRTGTTTPEGGELNFSLSIAYYAHLLRNSDGQGPASYSALNNDEVQLFLSWAEAYGIPRDQAQGAATMPIRQIINWMTRRENRPSEAVTALVIRFIREVNQYFTSENKRSLVRTFVENEIQSKRPDLVIAHSLGSVIAYEALWNCGYPIERLLTVGSPLGLKGGIFDRVAPGPVDGVGRKPQSVRQWLNVADRGDIVAVPRFLSRRYSGIAVDRETCIGLFAFHSLGSYLKSTDVGQMIRFGNVAPRH